MEHILQVGDFYMEDGSILPWSDTSSDKANCIGIVYWVPTADDPLESHSPAWLEEYSTCIHGLVVGLKEQKSPWGTSDVTTDITDSETGGIFCGYSNTKSLESAYPGYGIVYAYTSLKNDVTLPSDKTSGWYVPSVGELMMLYQAKSQVNNSLSNLGITSTLGSSRSSSYYWSSGENSRDDALTVNLYNGDVYLNSKGNKRYVRLSFAF